VDPVVVPKDGFINLGGKNAIQFTGTKFVAQVDAKIIESFQSSKDKIYGPGNKHQIAKGNSPPSKTHEFIPALNSETTSIEFQNQNYFVVKTAASGWGNWFLLRGENRTGGTSPCHVGLTPKCVEITVWKAQQ